MRKAERPADDAGIEIPPCLPAYQSRPAHPSNPACRPCSRACDREAHSADVRRRTSGGDWVVVSGPASSGGEGLDSAVLGTIRERQAGQVLSAYVTRAQTARRRTIQMGRFRPRDGIDSESSRSGSAVNSFFRKLRGLTRRSSKEAELREELQFHLEEEAEERQEHGLANDEARWAARRELGNLALVEENTRAAWGWT
jgi:hypothetical protein